MDEEKKYCRYCEKKLIKFKNEESIGYRKYHKKCEKQSQNSLMGLCYMINNFYDEVEENLNQKFNKI